MSTSNDQILELLDGELDPMVEPTLFAELASNTDLRTEFKQQLAIRTAVQEDRMALLPPAALTSAVFAGLGFAAPIAGAAAGAVGGAFRTRSNGSCVLVSCLDRSSWDPLILGEVMAC